MDKYLINSFKLRALEWNGSGYSFYCYCSSFPSDWAPIKRKCFISDVYAWCDSPCFLGLECSPFWTPSLYAPAYPQLAHSLCFQILPSSLFLWRNFLILCSKRPPMPVIPFILELTFSTSLFCYIYLYSSLICASFIFTILWDPWNDLCLIVFFNSSLQLA